MNIKRKTVLSRCFTSLLAGVLVSCLVMSAFASLVTVEGTKYSFTVGSKRYENFALLQKTEASGITALHTTARVNSLDGICPAMQLGEMAMILKQTSTGGYTLFEAGEWNYNENPSVAVIGIATKADPPAGYYIGQGRSAIYVNGDYERPYTYGTPLIQVKY